MAEDAAGIQTIAAPIRPRPPAPSKRIRRIGRVVQIIVNVGRAAIYIPQIHQLTNTRVPDDVVLDDGPIVANQQTAIPSALDGVADDEDIHRRVVGQITDHGLIAARMIDDVPYNLHPALHLRQINALRVTRSSLRILHIVVADGDVLVTRSEFGAGLNPVNVRGTVLIRQPDPVELDQRIRRLINDNPIRLIRPVLSSAVIGECGNPVSPYHTTLAVVNMNSFSVSLSDRIVLQYRARALDADTVVGGVLTGDIPQPDITASDSEALTPALDDDRSAVSRRRRRIRADVNRNISICGSAFGNLDASAICCAGCPSRDIDHSPWLNCIPIDLAEPAPRRRPGLPVGIVTRHRYVENLCACNGGGTRRQIRCLGMGRGR